MSWTDKQMDTEYLLGLRAARRLAHAAKNLEEALDLIDKIVKVREKQLRGGDE